jgi:hypothetical protein
VSLETAITLDDVLTVVGLRRVPLAPELAGYLALELAEGADAEGGDLDPKSIFISEEGTVGLVRTRRGGEAEGSIRSLLTRLLDVSGSHTTALVAVTKRRSGRGLGVLSEELEAALVPVNRAAGRRALARLAREVRRVTLGLGRNASEPRPPASSVPGAERETPRVEAPVREVSQMALEVIEPDHCAGPPTPPAPPTPAPPAVSVPDAEAPNGPRAADRVDELVATFQVKAKTDQVMTRELKALVGLEPTPPPPRSARARAEVDHSIDVVLTDPSVPLRVSGASGASAASGQPRARSRYGVLFFLATAVLAAAGVWWNLRAPVAVPSVPTAPVCRAMLLVTDVPPQAEVLLRLGVAPIDVERMPVGTRLEFVATAEGHAAKRATVAAGTRWDTGPEGRPRLELAVQLDPLRPGASEIWPPGEPGSEVGGKGPAGTVRVVSTPRGADLWILEGMAPEARIADLKCDADVEVLIAGPTTLRKRLRVPAAAFGRADDPKAPVRAARISAK